LSGSGRKSSVRVRATEEQSMAHETADSTAKSVRSDLQTGKSPPLRETFSTDNARIMYENERAWQEKMRSSKTS
jgi:hypothetical protein